MCGVEDTKDWTWVLDERCPQCGYDAASVTRAEIGDRVRAGVPRWTELLAAPGAAVRPAPEVWSPLEYACHVRDVQRVFAERVALILAEDDPQFENWDQDRTAEAEGYAAQDPATVAADLAAATETVAAAYDAVPAGDEATWARPGRRSNGSVFSLDSLARYHLHDLEHHVWDVRAAGA